MWCFLRRQDIQEEAHPGVQSDLGALTPGSVSNPSRCSVDRDCRSGRINDNSWQGWHYVDCRNCEQSMSDGDFHCIHLNESSILVNDAMPIICCSTLVKCVPGMWKSMSSPKRRKHSDAEGSVEKGGPCSLRVAQEFMSSSIKMVWVRRTSSVFNREQGRMYSAQRFGLRVCSCVMAWKWRASSL